MNQMYKALQKAAKSITEDWTSGDSARTMLRALASERTAVAVTPQRAAEIGPEAPPATPCGNDRRKRARAQVKMQAGIRSSQSITNSFREVVTTENASRDGLCFRSTAKHYQAGLQVRVTFPYSSHHNGIEGSENCADVVRLDTSADGRNLVAVAFRPASYTAASNRVNAPTRAAGERRQHKRLDFSARAVIRQDDSVAPMNARCSELGLGGCYIDTLNPFAIGMQVLIEIQNNEQVLETFATVCSSHFGSGMGLSFQQVTPELRSILSAWLQ